MDLSQFERTYVREFMGVFDRGDQDSVPPDHFIDALNLDFAVRSIFTRRGATTRFTFTIGKPRNTVRQFVGEGITPLLFSIDDDGKIYKDNTLLTTVASAIEFGAVEFFNKMFISPRDSLDGVGNLLVYDKVTNTFREAGGLAPTAAGAMIAVDGAAGVVPLGTRKLAVIYQTNTGYYTKPGPEIASVFTPTSYTGPGGLKINVSVIPLGPTEVVKRYILSTRADENEYFFVPDDKGGLINDNVTTTTILDFFDTDLIESADYLFDILERIPAGTGLCIYNGKLAIWGFPSPDGSLVRVSNAGEPETFDGLDSNIVVSKDDGYRAVNGVVIRDVLYVFKERGIHATSDNGDTPSNWEVATVDKAIGTTIKGISTVSPTEESGTHSDLVLVADRSGLYLFDGVVRVPELSWKIRKLWDENLDLSQADIFIDVHSKCIYVTGYNNGVLIGNYEEGIDPQKIKWCPWSFSLVSGITIAARTVLGGTILKSDTTSESEFVFNFDDVADLKLYKLSAAQKNDYGTDGIITLLRTALISKAQEFVSLFGALKLRITGEKKINLSLDSLQDSGGDQSKRFVVRPITLVNQPGFDITRYPQLDAEAASIRFDSWTDDNGLVEKDSWFRLSLLVVFQKAKWVARPQ